MPVQHLQDDDGWIKTDINLISQVIIFSVAGTNPNADPDQTKISIQNSKINCIDMDPDTVFGSILIRVFWSDPDAVFEICSDPDSVFLKTGSDPDAV